MSLVLGGWLTGCRGPSPAEEAERYGRLHAVLWARTAAEYQATAEQAFAVARLRLDESLEPGHADWTAAIEQQGDYHALPPAVIVDIDEAILDTSDFQADLMRRGGNFDIKRWNAWVARADAPPLPGALDFAHYADSRGVKIFYVTNRSVDVESSTLENLVKLGFPVDADGANLLTKDEEAAWVSDKTSRRAQIAAKYRVVLIVGDDLNDFIAGGRAEPEMRIEYVKQYRSYWGTRWILLPNLIYGTWERSLYGFDETLSPAERLRRKLEALIPGT